MEIPTLWECLEVFQLQKELAQEKYLIPLDKDCTNKLGCDASAKLQNRLTVQEYVCYLTKRVVKNLDAYGRAKACLLYTSPSPRDQRGSRMPSSA